MLGECGVIARRHSVICDGKWLSQGRLLYIHPDVIHLLALVEFSPKVSF